MLQILSRDGKHIHILLERPKANETFGEKLTRAQLELRRIEVGHAFEDVLTFAHVRPFVGPNEIGNVHQQGVVTVASVFSGMSFAATSEFTPPVARTYSIDNAFGSFWNCGSTCRIT